MTEEVISVLKEEIEFILNNIGIDELKVIENNCMKLYGQTEGIRTCAIACSKINEMNKAVRELQNNTIIACKNVAYLADYSQNM